MAETPSLYFQDQQGAQVLEQTDLISARIDHGVLVVTILGHKMVHEKVLADTEAQISRHLKQAQRSLILDCTNLTQSVSSQFVGLLIKLRKTVGAAGGTMSLCGVSGSLREVIEVTKLQKLIPVHESLQTALSAIGAFSVWEKAGIDSVRNAKQQASNDAKATEYSLMFTPKTAFLAVGAIFILGITIGVLINGFGFSSAKPVKRAPRQNNTSAVLKNNPEALKTTP